MDPVSAPAEALAAAVAVVADPEAGASYAVRYAGADPPPIAIMEIAWLSIRDADNGLRRTINALLQD